MKHKTLSLFLLLTAFPAIRCGSDRAGSKPGSWQQEAWETLWRGYNYSGRQDSLILVTRPFFREAIAKGDTLAAAYSGAHIAQSFLALEKRDSVLHYLEQASIFVERAGNSKIGILYSNVQAGYYLKYELNYPKALEYFLRGYEYAKKDDSTEGMITSLSNIVYMFWIRSDRHGMEYARQAEALSTRDGVRKVMVCYARISMAMMHALCGGHSEALRYALQADRLVAGSGLTSLTSLVCLISADIYGALSQTDKAYSSYMRAIGHLKYAEPGVASLTLLKYAEFTRAQGNTEEAIELCKKGLALSSEYGNMEFRRELLRTLAELSYVSDNRAASLDYYRQYLFHLDSLSNKSIEQDFNHLRLDLERMKHVNETHLKNLALLRANRRILLFAFGLCFILILALSLGVLYRRKQKMYRTLVMQHQNYIQRFNRSEDISLAAEDLDKKGSNPELFLKIEKLMKTEKLYKRNDISLEMLSALLESNRTYVSKAINTFAGTTFIAYVNTYRIREAVRVISNAGDEMLFKQLADDLGFNSVTVFSKVFQRETGCTPSRYRREMLAAARKKVDYL